MSHKIVINTAFNDKTALEAALEAKGWAYRVSANRVYLNEGPGQGGYIDLGSGDFNGDSDFHSDAEIGPLIQAYGEALWTKRMQENGGYVESREVLEDGTIRLVGTVTVA